MVYGHKHISYALKNGLSRCISHCLSQLVVIDMFIGRNWLFNMDKMLSAWIKKHMEVVGSALYFG